MKIDIDRLNESELIDLNRRIVERYNKKVVTVVTEGGERWTVSPHLFMRVVKPVHEGAPPRDARVRGKGLTTETKAKHDACLPVVHFHLCRRLENVSGSGFSI